MATYPQSAVGLAYITYPAGPTPNGTDVTASASTNTKGTYTELAASAAFTSNWVEVCVRTTTAAAAAVTYLLDIATGAGGGETVRLPDIMVAKTTDAATTGVSGIAYDFPMEIASGTRIAARAQSTTGSAVATVSISLRATGGMPGIQTFVNYGSATGDSGGTSVDPGGVANTKGSYTQLTASTSAIVQALSIMAHQANNTAPANARWYLDLATGAGGSETVLIPDMTLCTATSTNTLWWLQPRCRTVLTYIAASTRIACRLSSSSTDATDRLVDVGLLTGTAPAESVGGGGGSFAFA